MIALTYSNTHFLTLNDKGEAESQREYIMIRGAAIGNASKTGLTYIWLGAKPSPSNAHHLERLE